MKAHQNFYDCLAWEQYNHALVLNNNLISEWL